MISVDFLIEACNQAAFEIFSLSLCESFSYKVPRIGCFWIHPAFFYGVSWIYGLMSYVYFRNFLAVIYLNTTSLSSIFLGSLITHALEFFTMSHIFLILRFEFSTFTLSVFQSNLFTNLLSNSLILCSAVKSTFWFLNFSKSFSQFWNFFWILFNRFQFPDKILHVSSFS